MRSRRCRSTAHARAPCSAASRARNVLGRYRGTPPADVDALVELMVRLSHFAADHADEIAEIDLNPVIVHAEGQGVSDRRRTHREARPPLAEAARGRIIRGICHGPVQGYRRRENRPRRRLIEIRRPPNNFFDIALIPEIAGALEALDEDAECRARGAGRRKAKRFAPAPISATATATAAETPARDRGRARQRLYIEGNRLFRTKKPIVAAVHGAAVGGGLGLAMVADFRVTCPEARFAANFTRLGFHPGFGLTVTLPEVIGADQGGADVLHQPPRRPAKTAYAMGLADVLVPQDQVRAAALKLAAEIAENSPLGLISTRATMRGDLADRVRAATEHELAGTDPAAQDRRLQGRRQGDRRTEGAKFRRPITNSPASMISAEEQR